MENILIVCLDKLLRQDIMRVLSKELGFLYADIDEILSYEMLNSSTISLLDANERMEALERASISRALDFDKCVLGISKELFVSNDNFEMFKMPKVFIMLSKAHLIAKSKWDISRLEQELLMFDKIDNLIKLNCDIVVDKGIKSVDEICQEIVSQLNKS